MASATEPDARTDAALVTAGARLRTVRLERGATLADVQERTGISTSTLSRLESGKRRVTLEVLLPLAREYGVTLDELVCAPATGDPRVHMRPVERDGVTTIPLTRRSGEIQAAKFVVPPGVATTPKPHTHEGYHWLYVLSGRLRLVLGEHDLLLTPGEAAEFDTRIPHWYGTPPGGGVEFLSLYGEQGERARMRARSTRRSRD